MSVVLHRELSRGNCITGKLHHPRSQINAQQIQIRSVSHEIARHIPWATGRIQDASPALGKQLAKLLARVVVDCQTHEFVSKLDRVLVKPLAEIAQ
jgi:hypothetical protein